MHAMKPAKYRPIYIKALLAAADDGPNDVTILQLCEHQETKLAELRAKLEQAEAARDRLVDVVARESHAVGISETMPPEARVRAMRAAIELAADALEDDHG